MPHTQHCPGVAFTVPLQSSPHQQHACCCMRPRVEFTATHGLRMPQASCTSARARTQVCFAHCRSPRHHRHAPCSAHNHHFLHAARAAVCGRGLVGAPCVLRCRGVVLLRGGQRRRAAPRRSLQCANAVDGQVGSADRAAAGLRVGCVARCGRHAALSALCCKQVAAGSRGTCPSPHTRARPAQRACACTCTRACIHARACVWRHSSQKWWARRRSRCCARRPAA
jgi:hypothetical protein